MIASHRRLDDAHHIVGGSRDGIAAEADGHGVGKVRRRSSGRRLSSGAAAEVPRNRVTNELPDVVVGHVNRPAAR